MIKYENLNNINSWINSHEEFIRHWAFLNNYKIWKEAKQPFHLGIQKKTLTNPKKNFFDYGPIQKIKITFQNQFYLKPYMENCDYLWWIQDTKVKVIDMNQLKDFTIKVDGDYFLESDCRLELKDNFDSTYFTPEQVINATIQILDTSEKINFAYKKSFDKYELSYFRKNTHKKAWIISITHNDTGFHASVVDWAYYSKTHEVKNVQLKRNGETFMKAIRGEISKKAHFKRSNEFSFYTEDSNIKIASWLQSYLKKDSVIDLLLSVFSIQADSACNYVNKEDIINISNSNIQNYLYLHSYKQSACLENNKELKHKKTAILSISPIIDDMTYIDKELIGA
ncbi:MAG: hypothetical protein LBD46_01860 [Endomicrobium sp.]|jgi:hypothetical protein|nr:hypothetical protein [Endomicrobium sp.]